MLSAIKSKFDNFNFVPPTDPSTTDNNKATTSSTNDSNALSKNPSSPPLHRPTLIITSYDRFTPPSHRPDLEYDCRTTPNPSAHIRRINTGLDPALQQQLESRSEFQDLLSQAEKDIKELMQQKKRILEEGARDYADLTVRVGCLCGSGHHRSVAFAELLGGRDWSGDGDKWEVRVEHRDLTERVVGVKRERREEKREG